MTRILFLDDDRLRHTTFTASLRAQGIEADNCRAETIAEAMAHLQVSLDTQQPFNYAFLDHDLGGEVMVTQREKTGQVVADFIAQMPPALHPRRVVLHSFNAGGAQAIRQVLQGAGVHTERAMFGSALFNRILKGIVVPERGISIPLLPTTGVESISEQWTPGERLQVISLLAGVLPSAVVLDPYYVNVFCEHMVAVATQDAEFLEAYRPEILNPIR